MQNLHWWIWKGGGGAPNTHLPNRPKILNFNAVVLENLAKSYVATPSLERVGAPLMGNHGSAPEKSKEFNC